MNCESNYVIYLYFPIVTYASYVMFLFYSTVIYLNLPRSPGTLSSSAGQYY